MKRQHLMLCIALLSILILLLHSSAHAATFTAFGPKTFVRGSSKPVIETASFNIKNPNTSYTLKIYNGGINSEYSKVSSAIIKLNGSTIFDTRDFNQQESSLQKQVNVLNSNQLQVELRSAPGSGLTVIIEGEDSNPPLVAIIFPVEGSYLNTPSINTTGTSSDSISWVEKVTVNGTNATLTGEAYTSNIQLMEGPNVIAATATDIAGNTGNSTVSVIIDTILPVITLDPVPSLTNKAQLTITGKIEDASPITALTISGKNAGAIGQSLFQFNTELTLSEGLNTIEIIVTDKAGNVGSSKTNIFLDTIPPNISISSPPNNTILNTPSITVTGAVTDAQSGINAVNVNGVSVLINGNTYTANIQLTEGANTLNGIATDKAGNTSSTSVTITLDTIAPVVTITSPANGSTVATSTITVTGTIDDSTATVTVNGINATVSNNAFTASNINLTEGTNTIAVAAKDSAGNQTSTSITITFSPGTVITIQDPADGSSVASSRISLVRGVIDDNTANVTINEGRCFVYNNTFTCRTWGIISLAEGANTVTVTAINSAGKTSEATITVYYHDSIQPHIYTIHPQSGGTVNAKSISVFTSVYDENTVTVTINNIPAIYINDPSYGLVYNAIISLIEGINTITVKASDAAGNTATMSSTITCDTVVPVTSITTPANASIIASKNISVTGVIDDNTATVTVNGVKATVVNNTFETSITLTEGESIVTVTTKDQAGNTSSSTITIYIDTAVPVISITSPKTDSVLSVNHVAISGSIDDNAATVSVNGVNALVTNNTFTASNIPLTEGTNIIKVVATDAAGNSATSSIAITYVPDTTPPIITITSHQDGGTINTKTIILKGTIDDSTATVAVNGITVTTTSNKFTVYNLPLTEGLNAITIIAKDPAGNQTKYTLTITCDITQPTVTSTNPALNITDVALDSGMTVTFSEAMNAESITTTNFTLDSTYGTVSGSVTYSGNTATFTPSSALIRDNIYTATIKGGSTGVKDQAGNPLATDYAWNFKTVTLPVQINITEPYEGTTINKSTALIKGTIKTQTQDVGVTVNGVIAEISGISWVAQVPLQIGQNTIEATATDAAGNTDKQTITLNTQTTDQSVKITTNPTSGIAPLNATFTIETSISNPTVSYKIDFEGDGVTDLQTTSTNNITHIYDTPGIYYPTVTVTDSQYNTYTETTVINVLDRTLMDVLLKGKWEGMKEQLAHGNIEGAVEYFSDSVKDKYYRVFIDLKDNLPSILSTFEDISMESINGDITEYVTLRNHEEGRYMYFIYFMRDKNGIWRINSM